VIFWIVAAALTGLVTALLIPPLMGRTRARSQGRSELAVYRAQLEELARDRARGILGETEADALRREVERRMVRAGRDAPPLEQSPSPPRPAVALAASLLIPAAALALYAWIGRPGLPSQPKVAVAEAPAAAADPQAAEVASLVAQLEARMAERPQDPVGWRLLGHAQGSLGRWGERARSYARAVAAGGADGETLSGWAEALIFAAGGAVTPPAEEVLRRALIADPAQPRARYYQGLARLQAGDALGALAIWRPLVAEAPADAPWTEFLLPSPGPGAEEEAAAEDLSPEEREAAIRAMVQRLADRLEKEPGDIEGWLRLAHSYGVLGQPQERRAALERAATLAPERADIQLSLAREEAGTGAEDAAARRLKSLLDRLPAEAPERAAAQVELNRLGDRD
jgi:cytochrome c-type biogenesis protein CcmH